MANIPKLLASIYDNLNPGGHVEIMETLMLLKAIDDSLDGHTLRTWNDMLVDGMAPPPHHRDHPNPVAGIRKIGKDPLAAVNLKQWMKEAGFVNVTEKNFSVPANPWARGEEQKMRGMMMANNLLEVASGITTKIMTEVYGWSREKVELFLVDVRAGLKDKSLHGYVPV